LPVDEGGIGKEGLVLLTVLSLLVVSVWWGGAFGGALIAILALIPASLVVYYAELRRIRSWLFYAAGALLARISHTSFCRPPLLILESIFAHPDGHFIGHFGPRIRA
jgi:hypothetical protein